MMDEASRDILQLSFLFKVIYDQDYMKSIRKTATDLERNYSFLG